MRPLIFAAVLLVTPGIAAACNPVQAIVAAPIYAQQIVAAPIVYQPVVQDVQMQQVAYAAPVVQQVVVRQRIVNRHRHPVRNTLKLVTPPYGCR